MPTVRFLHDTIEYTAVEGESLADAADTAGASIPFGCRSGGCGTCIIRVQRGGDTIPPPTDDERQTLNVYGAAPEAGYRLACQCTVHGDIDIEQP